ncbi:endocuticle structural glycoprotein SgAbd-4-like [Venturia canescens]|uniref:endocuticle structural glycoprotein SgAbd-4-like n=1 Tax=Venturia canescens TaxID=32260 RepID=UPI001C9D27F2|nr:endocuticle structural glycoprotein SgAbd-4-like [Venturia canescens]
MKFLIIAALVGVALAQQEYQGRNLRDQDQDQRQQAGSDDRRSTTFIPILAWNKEQEHDGTYRTSYETGNNIVAEESGYIKTFGEGEDKTEGLVQQGSYSYTSPDGQVISVSYTADETGFHVSGDHLPTPPPVSEEIQKGLDLIYAGIKQQQEADAREAAQKINQPQSQQIERNEDKKYRF